MELRLVRVTDRFDDACAFYGDVLGWPVTHEWPAGDGQGRGRIFGYGATARIELIEVLDGSTPPPLSGGFISFEVDDVVTVHERMVAAGHTIVAELAVQPWGHHSFRVLDPIGAEVVCFQHVGA
jgi:catechol 2,3-dioxygenase-like lactoylglutathione lyase family enzyme